VSHALAFVQKAPDALSPGPFLGFLWDFRGETDSLGVVVARAFRKRAKSPVLVGPERRVKPLEKFLYALEAVAGHGHDEGLNTTSMMFRNSYLKFYDEDVVGSG
jgi:hypothetical protein